MVTEINLDAVEQNLNQFDPDTVAQEDGWTVSRKPNAKGFKRYRVLTSQNDRHQIE